MFFTFLKDRIVCVHECAHVHTHTHVCTCTVFSRQLSRADMIFSLQSLTPLKIKEDMSTYTPVAPFILHVVGG